MARRAAELNAANPGQVAFIDFHHQDFDQPVTLRPTVPDRRFWGLMFQTALDDLAELVVPKHVVFCEGKRFGSGGRKPSFDVEVYRTIFSSQFPDVEFVPLGGPRRLIKMARRSGFFSANSRRASRHGRCSTVTTATNPRFSS
jgi:hypothetical protein